MDTSRIVSDLLLAVQSIVSGTATVVPCRLNEQWLECKICSTGNIPVIALQYFGRETINGLLQSDSLRKTDNSSELKFFNESTMDIFNESKMEASSVVSDVFEEETPEELFVLPDLPDMEDDEFGDQIKSDGTDSSDRLTASKENSPDVEIIGEIPGKASSVEISFGRKHVHEPVGRRKCRRVHNQSNRTTVNRRQFNYNDFDATLASNWERMRQERTHSEENLYTYIERNVSFSHLNVRKRIHTDKRLFSCDQCGKLFDHISALNKHRRTHSEDLLFVCEFCDQSFIGKTQLIRHQRTHTSERTYSCNYCASSFLQYCDLTRHERKHLNEVPYHWVRTARKIF